MKILVTATIQFETEVRNGCTMDQAIHFGRKAIEDCMARWPNDYQHVEVDLVEVENMDSGDGRFK